MGGGKISNVWGAIVALGMLLGTFSGCTTQEGDTNIFLPGGPDGSVPFGECVPGITGICSGYGGLGQCTNGVRLCAPDGTWGHCVGEGLPSDEVCDAVDNDCDGQIDDHIDCMCSDEVEVCDDRRDNNCNGMVDEGCTCDPGVIEPCITDVPGACAYGTMRCRPDGVSFTECLPSAGESAETCDGIDNDCDGIADEDVCACTAGSSRGCLTGLAGACRTGTQTCTAAGRGFGPCLPTVTESDEVCDDGVDNDCDGTADEGCDCTSGASRPCVSPLPGECAAGLQTCTASVWGHCIPDLGASPEACDGLDNDCDGLADEEVCSCTPGDVQTCHSGLPGACDIGERTCAADGRGYGTCLSLNVPSAERCNGVDDDCDGVADDDGVCSCTTGATRGCRTGEDGVCGAGTQVCADGGRGYTPCLPTSGPGSEACDGLDNDCDGVADEEVCACTPLSTRACVGDLPGQCAAGSQACSADGRGWGPCLNASGPTSETCDGIDNDCDGEADEEVCTCTPFDVRLCPTGFPGECADGVQFCSADGRAWSPCEPFIWPWMSFPDLCGDGVDSDCDGTADEGCDCTPGAVIACTSVLPGRCSAGTRTCTPDGRMYGDCIPASGSVPETCNGVDDDCDGVADEEVCACTPFATRGCISGLGGVCAAGTQACSGDGRGWGTCLPTTGPSPDVCGDGLDSDCDGTADEGCDCAAGTSRTCVTTLPGACSAGTQDCTDGLAWGPCVPTAAPAAETCDGIDNDCDGPSDEEVCTCTSGATAGCLTGLPGVCSAGTMTCTAGGRGFTACLPTSEGTVEVCDGLDNDCDGMTDEDVCSCMAGETRPCLTGLAGRCAAGTETCRLDGRGFNGCIGANAPIPETCNGVDDDCDGVADEEVCSCIASTTRACNSGAPGVCSIGSQTCDLNGRGWSPCLSVTGPSADLCTDGIDSDCDGTADEGCSCTPGLIRGCITGIPGACSGGSQTCDAGGHWAPCLPAIAPAAEACNGSDDDCDGSADEDGVCTCTAGASASCLTGLPGLCSAGLMTCTSGGRGFTACLPTGVGVVEVCDGLDNDCDGAADEGVCACAPGAVRGCETGIPGICSAGSQTCDLSGSGWGPCLTAAVRSADACGDGLDTDCDGTADEDCTCTSGTSRPCTSGLPGVCAAGTQACTGGRWDACIPAAASGLETCDGRDNDCDGVADEEVCACTPLSTRACATSLPGLCSAGTQTCAGDGRGWNACIPSLAPTADICGDGVDSDCDGEADEDCTCTTGASRTCLTGLFGACGSGSQICDAGRSWGPCLPSAGPSSETCDGTDNDCDGSADDDGVCTCTVGATAGCLTGLAGVCAGGTMTCTSGGRGFTACLPSAAGSAEVCNGLDDDCDGTADEEVCTCPAGTARACDTGQPGSCAAGTQTCDSDGRGWGACLSGFVRSADACGDGLDNDCDGTADEDCTCTSGTSRPCTSGLDGVCSAGLQACTGGRWDACIPTGVATLEVCNGRDDDCDGVADEDVCTCTPLALRACVTSLPGICAAGTQRCDADGRGFGPCTPTSAPTVDACTDGVDNDCDGTADEGCTCTAGVIRACDTGRLGICGAGTQACAADGRSWNPCLPSAGPGSEICDGSDNDCDGVADEEVCTCIASTTRACITTLPGVCAAGLQTCSLDGRGWGTCLPTTAPAADACTDGMDNDCDGTADEGCTCTAGTTRTCLTGIPGVCGTGLQTCDAGRTWGPCLPTIAPSSDTCNGVDDDCDGPADEDGVCSCAPGASMGCLTGLPGVCSAGIMTCTAGGRGFTACLPTIASAGETCNGLDDDCDGTADEDGVCTCVPGITEACTTGLPGACGAGTHTCRSDGRGYGPCVGATGPTSEVCDGVDNDCDANADEDVCTCIGGTTRGCLTGLSGVCAAGTQTCDADGRGWSHCTSLAGPSADTCGDGLDSDCDGTADEGCICTSGASRACTTGLDGTCSIGAQTCDAGGRWTPCIPTVAPLAETCPGDGLDSDCDGTADEGCVCAPGAPESCLTGLLGLCTMGSMTCRPDGRSFTACLPLAGPVSEIPSNGTDDDCNGVTDDVAACTPASTVACATGMTGVCASGTATCLPSGSGYGPCVPATFGSAETCADALDNNCDGRVNEGCACAPGSALSCSTGMPGACAAGTTTCLADGTGYGPCVPGAFPVPEVCNDRDDDCNGFIDNGLFFCP